MAALTRVWGVIADISLSPAVSPVADMMTVERLALQDQGVAGDA
jgi:hypothetical protein